MKDRILAFLHNENKSYAQFAEEIGVQPSGISHILSGRNNPSLDFVIKMLHRYPSLSSDWLLFGRGSMYKSEYQPTLFDEEFLRPDTAKKTDEATFSEPAETEERQALSETVKNEGYTDEQISEEQGKKLIRVLFFYSDKTFSEYRPD